MPVEELEYTIPNDGQGGAGSQVKLFLTYQINPGDPDGPTLVTAASGSYDTLGANGQIIDSDTVTGIDPAGSFDGNDNELFINPGTETAPFVTGNGISFTINDAADSNDAMGNVNFYSYSDDTGATFYGELGEDGDAASSVTETVPCFTPSTKILTKAGEVPVEALKVGDEVLVHGGGAVPIIWIGRRDIDTRSRVSRADILPIHIAAGAFLAGVPSRSLLVSPDHALYFDGHLIPARSLTNGFTIRQIPCQRVTYIHLELAQHSLIWAEGALTESFLECGSNRSAFKNGGVAQQLHPDFNNTDFQAARIARSCAPFVDNGPIVHEVRRRLLLRAQIPMTRDHGTMIEFVDDYAVVRSRVAVPGQTELDPGDQRELGIKIGSMRIGGVAVDLNHPLLARGWHQAEPDGRWTNGRAVVPAELLGGSRDVELTLAWTTLYPLQQAGAACR